MVVGLLSIVSSCAHQIGQINIENINLRNGAYTPLKAYSQSKLCNVLFTTELAKRLNTTDINAYSLNPGLVNTEITRHAEPSSFIKKYVTLTPEMGSQTTLYCVLDEQLDNESGFYYE